MLVFGKLCVRAKQMTPHAYKKECNYKGFQTEVVVIRQSKVVFRTPSNIYDGVFLRKQLLAVNYFRKKNRFFTGS